MRFRGKSRLVEEIKKWNVLSPKTTRQKFYFTEWDYCKDCHHVQHYEKFKVFNQIIYKSGENTTPSMFS